MGRKRLNHGANNGLEDAADASTAATSTTTTTAATSNTNNGAIEFNERDPVSVFANLTLQGVVKENHAARIVDCCFCRVHR
jgi:hypothetical protein